MLTTIENEEEDWDEDTLVNEVPESDEAKLTFVKKMLSELKERKKGGEMLVMSKTSCSIDHDDLLTNIEVSEFQEIRDDLRRLVRDHLDDGLSLLKMNYQPNKWYVSVSLRLDKFKVFHSATNRIFLRSTQDLLNGQWVNATAISHKTFDEYCWWCEQLLMWITTCGMNHFCCASQLMMWITSRGVDHFGCTSLLMMWITPRDVDHFECTSLLMM